MQPVSCFPVLCALERVGHRILILGDGNFSFSLTFARLNPDAEIYTSVFECSSEYAAKYPSGSKNIAELRACHSNIHILFSVDACALPREWNGFFDDIIWNFPHHCGKTNLRKSRQLMRSVFASIGRNLSSGFFHITLASGQSGLDFASVSKRRPLKYQKLPAHRMDSWQIVYLAAEEKLILREASVFEPDKFSTYVSSGYRNSERSFHCTNKAVTLTFQRTPTIDTIKSMNDYESRIFRFRGLAHEWRPFYLRDLSIVYMNPTKVDHLEQILFTLIEELCVHVLIDLYEVEDLRTHYNGNPNRIYRLIWQSWGIALSRKCCNSIHEEMKFILADYFAREHLEMIVT